LIVQENQKKSIEEGTSSDHSYPVHSSEPGNSTSFRFPLFTLVALLIPLADQVSKWVIVSRLSLHESISVIPGFLWITRIHNSGIAFGFFPGLPRLFMAVTILSMFVVLYFYLTIQPRTLLTTLGCAFILGGAAGNLVDRIHYGHVVDFINFSFWPAFNLADSAVSIGVAFLLASFLFEKKELEEHASNLV